MEVWKIVLGVVTAAFLIHFRGAYVQAQRQRAVLTRLHSYLLYWQGWVIDNDIFSLFYIGVEWNKEVRERLAKGEGAESLVKLKEEKKKKIDEIKEALAKEELKLDVDGLKKQLDLLPKDSVAQILRYSERFDQNLLDGKTFVSDDEAAALGPYFSQTCVRLKMTMITMVSKGLALVISLISNPERFAIKDKGKEVADIIWHGVLVSKDIDELSDYVNKRRARSLMRLTWDNLWL